jgi:hypothetical protein
MSLLNKTLGKDEKFAAEIGIGVTDDFASVVSLSALKVDVAMNVEHPEDLYVMQVFIPKKYQAVKIDCRIFEVYPIKRTIVPRYTCYQQAKNDIRKDVKAAIFDVSFEMLKTSTVKDGGENTDRYEINFLAAPSKDLCKNTSKDYVSIGELPLLITLVNPNTAERKYDEIDYMIRAVDGSIEIVNRNSGEIIRRPQF